MQWLLLLIILIIVFRYDQIRNFIKKINNQSPKIDHSDSSDDDDEYTDYEEIK